MVPGGGIALLALAALAPLAAPAAPEPFPVHIDFDAPAGCSDAKAFYDGVLSRIDRARLVKAGQAGVRLAVRVTRSKGAVHGELRLIDEQGATETRKVDGASCREVVEVLSLTAAIAIDPSARLSARADAPSPTEAAPAAPASRTPSAPAATAGSARDAAAAATAAARAPAASPSTSASPSGPSVPSSPSPVPEIAAPGTTAALAPGARGGRRFELGVAAETAAAQVLSTSPSLGGAIAARLTLRGGGDGIAAPTGPPPSLGLALLYLPNDLVQSPAEVVARLTAVTVTACPGWGFARRVVVQGCAIAIGGWLTASNRAVTNAQSAGRSWWALGAIARAVMPLGGGFGLQLEAGLTVPLAKRRFVTTTPDRTVAETAPVAPLLGLGIGYGL